ncbi:MAG: outer membrane beta-barrel domain-containing protein [Myxococcales bacterium]|nr:outer membrane beta-barrel domain-containing protein [Myxococcales bacterium]
MTIVTALALCATAYAQEGDAPPAEASELDPQTDVGPGTDEELSVSDITPSNFPRIVDEEETIYAVQRKAYLVREKLEVSVMFSALFNDRFVESYAPVGSVTYHLAENFGLELFGGYFIPNPSDGRTELVNAAGLRPEFARLTELLWAVGIGGQWSPVYGKLEIAGRQLGNFNFYLSAGVAVGQTRTECIASFPLDPGQFGSGQDFETCEEGTGTKYEPEVFRPMGSFAGGLRFYFNERIGLRFEVRDYVFASRVYRPSAAGAANQTGPERFSDAIRNNLYANIGISFLFGGEDN